jgi:sugar phosphate isomerase/epimerase
MDIPITKNVISRRVFSATVPTAFATALSPSLRAKKNPRKRLLLGFDNFSIRALGWKAARLIEYATQHKVDALLFSDLDVYDSLESGYLREIRQEALSQKIIVHAGTGGVCSTSKSFKNKHGTAEQHLRLLIRVAKEIGSPVARCYLGSSKDRKSVGGIHRHVEHMIATLKKVRSEALDAGVRLAVENHAGDMHSRELVKLIETAGPDFVGATVDTGNATWTLEDPLETFRNLSEYAICSGIRDSMVWPSARGAKVQWTAMGEGCVDMSTLFKEWSERCPETPVQIETISGFAREFPYLEKSFWPPYATIPSNDFSRFLSIIKKGKVLAPFSTPNGKDKIEAQKQYQLDELEKSFVFCRKHLGIGRKSV